MKTEQHSILLKLFFLVLFFGSLLSYAQTTTPFVKRYETTGINGDLTIIGNSILGDSSDTPYNGTTQNNFIEFINKIDNNSGNTGKAHIWYDDNGTEEMSLNNQGDLTTVGAMIPGSFTTSERNALTPVAGMMIYNTTDNKHQGYNGSTWNDFY